MIDGVHLVAEAIRAEQEAAAKAAAGKTDKTLNLEKSEDDPVTAITGKKTKKTKKTEPDPKTEPEKDPEGDQDDDPDDPEGDKKED